MKQSIVPYVLPSILVLALVAILPVMFLAYMSTMEYELGYPWSAREAIGPGHYVDMFSGRTLDFWYSFRLTAQLTLLCTALSAALGAVFGVLLHRRLPGKAMLISILLLPMAISPVIVGLMWKLMYNYDYGVINFILEGITGHRVLWLGKEMAYWSTVITIVWMRAPFIALVTLAGLQALPKAPLEAAQIDGASYMQVLYHIVIPILRPILLIGVLLQLILVMQTFSPIYILTGGGPGRATTILGLLLYRFGYTSYNQIGLSSAIAVVLTVLTLVLSLPFLRMLARSEVKG